MHRSNLRRFFTFNSSIFSLKLIALLALAPLVLGLPMPTNSSESNWSTLPNSVKGNVLKLLNPSEIATLMASSTSDQDLVAEYVTTMNEAEKMPLFHWAAENDHLRFFEVLIGNETFAFSDSDVLLTACSKGAASIVPLFFKENPKAVVPFYSMEKLRDDCVIEAAQTGQVEFLRVTGLPQIQTKNSIQVALDRSLRSNQLLTAKFLFSLIQNEKNQLLFNFVVGACLGDISEMASAAESSLLTMGDLTQENFEDLLSPAFEQHRPDIFSLNPLECAISRGHANSLDFILELNQSGANFEFDDELIELVIEKGSIEMLRILEEHQVPAIDSPSEFLVPAAASGSMEILEWALKGATFSAEQIRKAKQNANSTQILNVLTEKFGTDLPSKGLVNAADIGDKDLVDLYLNLPEFSNFPSSIIEESIENAIMGYSADILEAILSKTWNRFEQDDMDAFFLLACGYNDTSVLKVLLNSAMPANPAAYDNQAFITVSQDGFVNVMKFLVDLENKDIDPSAMNNEAFIKAAQLRQFEALDYLISLHEKYPAIDPAAQDNRAFRIAAYTGDIKMARYLLSLRNKFPAISPSARDNSPIKLAVSAGQSGMVQFLLSLPEELGVDKRIAEMDKENIQVEDVDELMGIEIHE